MQNIPSHLKQLFTEWMIRIENEGGCPCGYESSVYYIDNNNLYHIGYDALLSDFDKDNIRNNIIIILFYDKTGILSYYGKKYKF